MKTLHWYLTRQVLAALVMALLVFTFVLVLGNVLKELIELLLHGRAPAGALLQAIGLLIPYLWVFALPTALLTATLLVFGRFSADQELTAVRASGVSLLSVLTPILLLSLLLCGLSALVNLEIAPRCRVAYKNLLATMKLDVASVQLPEGRFITDYPGYLFYIGRNRREQLQDVLVFASERGVVTRTLHAARGQLHLNPTNRQVIIELLNVKGVDVAGGRRVPFSAARVPILLDLNPAPRAAKKPRLSDLTFQQLRAELRELERQMQWPTSTPDAPSPEAGTTGALRPASELLSPIRVQMHRQVAFSFACFGFALVGVPLGVRLHRRETNVSFAVALVLLLVYYGLFVLAQSLDTRPEFAPHLLVWVPNFLFQAVGAVLLARANRGW
ncbi:MAG: LptF/LptG family permease [Verrucomicrobiae bacterium]|nr:LptF/LptG family permease [Verrucomicrobiae bacterium]